MQLFITYSNNQLIKKVEIKSALINYCDFIIGGYQNVLMLKFESNFPLNIIVQSVKLL